MESNNVKCIPRYNKRIIRSKGVGEGVGDGDVGSIPCEVWVNCGGESEALHVDTGLVVRKELTGKLYSGGPELEGRSCGSPWSLGKSKSL